MASLPEFIWINGSVTSTLEARISPFDHGVTVGDGVFETMAVRGGHTFALSRHWARLKRSGEALGIVVPDIEVMRTAFAEVMRANGLVDARVRFTVTSGDGPPGTDQGHSAPTLLAVATPLVPWGPFEKVITVPWTRNDTGALVGIKCTSYAENVRALRLARQAGAGEAILANTKGHLCEGTGSNIFINEDGVIRTPPLSSGCLGGVTRGIVIEACKAAGLPLEECVIPFAILATTEEAFLTSCTREVHPIGEIDGRVLRHVPGSLTQKAKEAFAAYAGEVAD